MIEFKDSPFMRYFAGDADAPANPSEAYARHAEIFGTYLSSIPEGKAGFRYQAGKWSVSEVIGHVTDADLVFCYRMVSLARGEQKPLPGFEEDEYVANANFDSQPWRTLLNTWRGLSQAIGGMAAGFDDQAWARAGSANGVRMTAREMLWVLIGHERHHMRMLKERYGLG
jgi:uncharacterized damage-inducible protein DinB